MNRLLTTIVIAALAVAPIVGCAGQDKSNPDCSRDFATVKTELVAMTQQGQFQKAQEKAEFYEPCYGQATDYWMMRLQLLPKRHKPGSQSQRRDALKGVKYLNHVLKLNPEDDSTRVFKSAFLITAGKYKKGIDLYERQVEKVFERLKAGKGIEISDAIILEVSPVYIRAMRRRNGIDHAKAVLQPYLSHACYGKPMLRKNYAVTLIWLHKIFSGQENPAVTTNKAAQAKALKQACQSFKP